MAISPYGRWGPMFHAFLFGGQDEPCLRFHQSSANAARMYHRARSPAAQGGIIPRAFSRWKATKAKEQHFYGSSWSTPTPKEYVYQRLGLVIITALAQHLRDAKRGELATAPSTHAPPELGCKICSEFRRIPELRGNSGEFADLLGVSSEFRGILVERNRRGEKQIGT